MRKVWLNNKIVSESQAKISVFDRGFLYGDGIYETVRVYDGKIFRSEEHWKRLDHSLKGIQLKVPWSHRYLDRACSKVIKSNSLKEALVRVTISRGIGALGYDPSSCKKPTLVIIASPIRKELPQLWGKGVEIAIVNRRRNHPNSLDPAIKSTNCLNGILAKIESLKLGVFEALFLNLDGYVTEGTISNIFIVREGVVKTPNLKDGLLDGVTRKTILQLAKQSQIKLLETRIKPSEIFNADELFLTSTTMEVMPIIKVNKKVVGTGLPGPLTKCLHKKFKELLQKELRIEKVK